MYWMLQCCCTLYVCLLKQLKKNYFNILMVLELPFLLLLRRRRHNWTMNNGKHSIHRFIHNQHEQFVRLYVLGLYHLHRKWSLLSIVDNIIALSMDYGLRMKRNRPTRIAKSYCASLWTNWRFFVRSKVKQPQLSVLLRHIENFVWNWKLKEFTLKELLTENFVEMLLDLFF